MGNAPRTLDQTQQQVESMMEHGTSFNDVEDVINASKFSSEFKAALWLLAWSLRDVEHQRQDARLTVTAVGAGECVGWS
jgi:hypothetical protein